MSNKLTDLEKRLLRLQGLDCTSSNEQELQERLNNLQAPETLHSHTHQDLAARFSSIFGAPDVSTTPTPDAAASGVVDIYLAAVVAAQDGSDTDNWEHEESMSQQAFLGSSGGNFSNEAADLMAEAQDAVRMSATVVGGFGIHHNHGEEDEDEDEDEEVLAIIQASKDEIRLSNKYGEDKDQKKTTKSLHKKHKTKHKKKQKRKQKKKRRRSFSSDSDSESSDSHSDSESASSDSSSDGDSDRGSRKHKRDRKEEGAATQATPVTPVEEFKVEEANTLARLRDAVRAEGKDSELVKLLASKLVQLRKQEKRRLRTEIQSLKLNRLK